MLKFRLVHGTDIDGEYVALYHKETILGEFRTKEDAERYIEENIDKLRRRLER